MTDQTDTTQQPLVLVSKSDYLSIVLKEYEMLRAEQRTRLDVANRLIHYNILVIAAVVAGLLASYGKSTTTAAGAFEPALFYGLLLIPLLSLPLAFAQWSDEIIVLKIGLYLDSIGAVLRAHSMKPLPDFWRWEEELRGKRARESDLRTTKLLNKQGVTAVVRSGIFLIFSLVSIIGFIVTTDRARIRWYDWVFVAFDVLLLVSGVCIGVNMVRDQSRSPQRDGKGASIRTLWHG